MKALKIGFGLACVALFYLGCAGKRMPVEQGEKLIWQSESKRPDWTFQTSIAAKDGIFFVGTSDKFSTEKYSRDDAEHDAFVQAAKGLGTAAKDVSEKMISQLNLAENVMNPSVVGRDYQEVAAGKSLSETRVETFYIEQWRKGNTKEDYFKTFAKLYVPRSSIQGSFEDFSKQKQADWKLTQDQLNKVNSAFKEYWDAKKAEAEGKGTGE